MIDFSPAKINQPERHTTTSSSFFESNPSLSAPEKKSRLNMAKSEATIPPTKKPTPIKTKIRRDSKSDVSFKIMALPKKAKPKKMEIFRVN